LRTSSALPPRLRDTLPEVIIDRAVYRDGQRTEPVSLSDFYAACHTDGSVGWLGLYQPSADEFAEVAREFDLHELAVEDTIKAHQRPKLERYGDTLFLVLRPARYIEEAETVEFGEIHVFVGPRFVITVRHGQASALGRVRQGLEARPQLLRRGPMAIVHAIVDRVVDDYAPVIAGVEGDIDEIEEEVFAGKPEVSRRVYKLSREVIEFGRATRPLADILQRLMTQSAVGEEERRYLRDVQDHALRVQERADAFHELLRNILSVNLTLETKALSEAGNRQNEEVKKISAWAAILFAPTIVGTVYGMNFEHMPELEWLVGYPMAIALMVAVSLSLYLLFKHRGWI
jgi:magnesium transporter